MSRRAARWRPRKRKRSREAAAANALLPSGVQATPRTAHDRSARDTPAVRQKLRTTHDAVRPCQYHASCGPTTARKSHDPGGSGTTVSYGACNIVGFRPPSTFYLQPSIYLLPSSRSRRQLVIAPARSVCHHGHLHVAGESHDSLHGAAANHERQRRRLLPRDENLRDAMKAREIHHGLRHVASPSRIRVSICSPRAKFRCRSRLSRSRAADRRNPVSG